MLHMTLLVSRSGPLIHLSYLTGVNDARLDVNMKSMDGPNALWHFDQNDQLRQFGFDAHGAIDDGLGR